MQDVIQELAPVLKVQQVAAFFGIHPQVVYEQIHQGKIVAVRLGRALRVPRSEVERLLAEAEQARGGPDAAASE